MSRFAIDVDMLRRYDRAGPRYTSYPTAVEFHEDYGVADYEARLAEADAAGDRPLSLYLHLPFCSHRCAFCGCNVVIARDHAIASRYLDYLHREIDLLAAHLPSRRRISQYHWGGGTPTYQTVAEMEALHRKVTDHFRMDPDAEVAVEVDPRVTTREQLEAMRDLGFNRISLGIQDTDPGVQDAIGRNQSERQSRELYDLCRTVGFESINLDLVYGLPRQTTESFERTLEVVLDLRPDRVALYSYAHLPSMRPNQKAIDPETLPGAETKLQLMAAALERFHNGGYAQIGMDHFALPGDELVNAMNDRRLHRNFMGYTVRMGADLLGLGVSAIGDVRGSFAQNTKKLNRYYDALDAGRFPIERGYALDRDDTIRRAVILGLMCNFHVDGAEIGKRFDVDFREYFADELAELEADDGPVAHGFVRLDGDTVDVLGAGKLLVRNVCMVFDAHLRRRHGAQPLFSRTI